MGLSLIFAVTYVIVLTLTLPKTDLAHGQSPFQDPLVFPIMSLVVGVSGLIAWPLFAVLGRHAPPVSVAKIAGLTTFAFIVVVTPIQAIMGWAGSYVICLGALVYCSARYRSRGYDQSAGRNKTGTFS